MEEAITVAILSVLGSIPADANYTLEATNNALTGAPVWQDVLADVKAGRTSCLPPRSRPTGRLFNSGWPSAVRRGRRRPHPEYSGGFQ